MKLFFRKIGEGRPLIILHGLFGMSDNWTTLSKSFSEQGFSCYLVDQRNHGRSPHSFEFNYKVLSDDLLELIEDQRLSVVDIIGHSMGAKTAMFFSSENANRIGKMVIADMAPKYYEPHHQAVLAAIHSVDPAKATSRREVEEKLRMALKDEATIQFLLKNLYWNDQEKLDWRFGFREIEQNIDETGKALPSGLHIDVQVLFIRGQRSGYITADDEIVIPKIFSKATFATVQDAGHWLHADQPKAFFDIVIDFLMK